MLLSDAKPGQLSCRLSWSTDVWRCQNIPSFDELSATANSISSNKKRLRHWSVKKVFLRNSRAMSEDDWRTWAEQMATGLALVDGELRLQWINHALAEWLQLGPRSSVGQPLGALLGDPELPRQAGRVLAEQFPMQWRGMVLTAVNGTEMRVDLALQPFEEGLLLEVHALAEPASTDSPLSATLRGFAHEVKNPLACCKLSRRRRISIATMTPACRTCSVMPIACSKYC
jgi:hypothetical protein